MTCSSLYFPLSYVWGSNFFKAIFVPTECFPIISLFSWCNFWIYLMFIFLSFVSYKIIPIWNNQTFVLLILEYRLITSVLPFASQLFVLNCPIRTGRLIFIKIKLGEWQTRLGQGSRIFHHRTFCRGSEPNLT